MSASVNVLVTGFGVRKRPCIPHVLQLMSSAVPRNDQQPFLDNRTKPTIVSAYHKILAQVPTLIQDNASDLVVHMVLMSTAEMEGSLFLHRPSEDERKGETKTSCRRKAQR